MTKHPTRYADLSKELETLTKRVEEARQAETRQAIVTCKQLILDYGLNVEDLGLVKRSVIPPAKVKKADKTFVSVKPKTTIPPKYQDPASGRTWSGRGHAPGWIVGDRDSYLIKTEPTKRITQNNKEAA